MRVALDLDDRALDALADRLLPRLAERMPAAPTAQPSRLIAAGDVAKLGGWPSRKAMEMAFVRARKRGEMHALERMAVHVDGGARRWREADVVAWIEAQR